MTNIQTMMMIMKPVVNPAVAGSVALSILQSWPPQPLGHRHVKLSGNFLVIQVDPVKQGLSLSQ